MDRLSAARSKLRQKGSSDAAHTKLGMLAAQKSQMAKELERLRKMCKGMEEENAKICATASKSTVKSEEHRSQVGDACPQPFGSRVLTPNPAFWRP